MPREKAINQIAFCRNEYGFDGFHFDEQRRNLYLVQFKYSASHSRFKDSLQRLIADGWTAFSFRPTRMTVDFRTLRKIIFCFSSEPASLKTGL